MRSNPAVTTSSPRTRLRAHSSTTDRTIDAGTATTARSMSSGISTTLAHARTPATSPPWVFTGYTGPVNPLAPRLTNSSWPSPPGSRPAPTTAIDAGASNRATERPAAMPERFSMRATASASGSMASVTSMRPSAKVRPVSNPARWNTLSMATLDGSTSAFRPVRPASRAATTRYSSNTVASPRPRWCSSTMNATSAVVRSGQRSNEPRPTTWSPSSATKAMRSA